MEATATRIHPTTVPPHLGDLALEQARLAALYSYDVLDSAPERGFDDLARMAAHICGVGYASITFLDHSRLWRKATFGLSVASASVLDIFSSEGLRRPKLVSMVSDAFHHPDWRPLALLTEDECFPIYFYASIALVTNEGHRIGAIEVMDNCRTNLTDAQLDSLGVLANTVMEKMEIRRTLRSLHAMHRHHEDVPNRSGAISASDLKAPLTSVLAFHDLLKRLDISRARLGVNGEEVTDFVGRSARQLAVVASKVPAVIQPQPTAHAPAWVNIPELIAETLGLLLKPVAATVFTECSLRHIRGCREALQQILLNLCSNAFRFIAKPNGELRISLGENDSSYLLYVSDNGPGIPEPRLSQIFAVLYDEDDVTNTFPGPCRGLTLVRRLAVSMGGNVVVDSVEGVGTTFCVSLPKID